MTKPFALLQLMRPANIATALADILAGFAITGLLPATITQLSPQAHRLADLGWLLLATIGLYGGGVVFNDVFDVKIDEEERPERPIPSGKVCLLEAIVLGSALLVLGIWAAGMVAEESLIIAIAVAALALLYDAWGKHLDYIGPLNMGLCRSGNLLLGISAVPAALVDAWMVAFLPLVYIAAVTSVSKGEVHGGRRGVLRNAAAMYLLVAAGLLGLGWVLSFNYMEVLPFMALFLIFIFPPLLKAYQQPVPGNIGAAVKWGIIALPAFNACLAAGFAGWQYGLVVLATLGLSMLLAKIFAVT